MASLRIVAALAWVLLTVGCRSQAHSDEPLLPEPDREFRAAWVAAVANIDWPSRPGLPAGEHKAEAIAMLDGLV